MNFFASFFGIGACCLFYFFHNKKQANKNTKPKPNIKSNTVTTRMTTTTRMTPLKSVDELSYWESGHDALGVCTVSLPSSYVLATHRPRLMHCHDMMGGYVEDAVYQGEKRAHVYNFCYMEYIDVFCYFSHYRVTIPPPSWSNSCHKNGVAVLGTFITEWDEGVVECTKLLDGPVPGGGDAIQHHAAQLAAIAVYYGFEGWLINIENTLSLEYVDKMLLFVAALTDHMHRALPGKGIVIWYDAVTVEGKLEWQDELNDLNKPFFDRCDGIFINYTWNRTQPYTSALNSNGRPFDIWTGTDVWGRNTYGGGGYNSYTALQVCSDAGTSSVLFAPAWTYENQSNNRIDFMTSEARLWCHPTDNSVATIFKPRAVIDKLPFSTFFNRGSGDIFCIDGGVVITNGWNNLSDMSILPNMITKSPTTSPIEMAYSFDWTFDGPTSLMFNGDFGNILPLTTFKLFDCYLPINGATGHSACYTYSGGVEYFAIHLNLDDGSVISLNSNNLSTSSSSSPVIRGTSSGFRSWTRRDYYGWGYGLNNRYLISISVVIGSSSSSSSYKLQNGNTNDISVLKRKADPIYLGQLTLDSPAVGFQPPAAATNLSYEIDNISNIPTIYWLSSSSSSSSDVAYYDIWRGDNYVYIGRSYSHLYVLDKEGENYIGAPIIIQAVGHNGSKLLLNQSSSIVINPSLASTTTASATTNINRDIQVIINNQRILI